MNEKKYLLGIDGGSQSTKLQIYDLEGKVVCEASHPLKACVMPKPGYQEHPGDDLWDSFVFACKELLHAFEEPVDTLVAAGLCTIRSCRTFLNENGGLASPVMSWLDSRAFGPIPMPPGARYASTTTGYFTHRLTGNFGDTVANNSKGQWPVDLNTWDWTQDEKEFEKWGITKDDLVPLHRPGSILGNITKEAAEATGLPEGLPIVATANDKSVEALGSGLIQEGVGLVSLGTYITGVVNGKDVLERGESFFCNFSSVPGQYLYECNGVWRGMWILSWLTELLGEEVLAKARQEGIRAEEWLSREAAKVPPGSEGLCTVPEWLTPSFLAHKKGMMIGFDVRHKSGHICRSIMEGIAMTMKNNFDRMCRETNSTANGLILSGGGSNSDTFAKIFADVFGVPVYRNMQSGAAGLGAAICAAVGSGVYKSFEEAVSKMVHRRDVQEPSEKNTRLYKRINSEVFSKLSAQNDSLLRSMKEILDDGQQGL